MGKRLIKILICGFLLIFLFSAYSSGDMIHLKNGQVLEGTVMHEHNDEVVVDVGGGTVTFSKGEIKSIEKSELTKIEKDDKIIFEERLSSLFVISKRYNSKKS